MLIWHWYSIIAVLRLTAVNTMNFRLGNYVYILQVAKTRRRLRANIGAQCTLNIFKFTVNYSQWCSRGIFYETEGEAEAEQPRRGHGMGRLGSMQGKTEAEAAGRPENEATSYFFIFYFTHTLCVKVNRHVSVKQAIHCQHKLTYLVTESSTMWPCKQSSVTEIVDTKIHRRPRQADIPRPSRGRAESLRPSQGQGKHVETRPRQSTGEAIAIKNLPRGSLEARQLVIRIIYVLVKIREF